jgi:hypothetical protein
MTIRHHPSALATRHQPPATAAPPLVPSPLGLWNAKHIPPGRLLASCAFSRPSRRLPYAVSRMPHASRRLPSAVCPPAFILHPFSFILFPSSFFLPRSLLHAFRLLRLQVWLPRQPISVPHVRDSGSGFKLHPSLPATRHRRHRRLSQAPLACGMRSIFHRAAPPASSPLAPLRGHPSVTPSCLAVAEQRRGGSRSPGERVGGSPIRRPPSQLCTTHSLFYTLTATAPSP